jgi:hypothetical protein
MEARVATTVEEFIAIMSGNSPNGAVLDWWLRVDGGLQEYAGLLVPPLKPYKLSAVEAAVERDPGLGPVLAKSLREMHRIRNRVAHEKNSYITKDKVVAYGRESFRVLGILGKRISELEKRPVPGGAGPSN